MKRAGKWGITAAFMMLAFGTRSLAEPSKTHSSLVTQWEVKNAQVLVSFAVSSSKDTILNLDAPWELRLSKEQGLVFPEKKLTKKQFKEGRIVVTGTLSPAASKQRQVSYKLVAFTCTSDKKQCYRDVHEGVVEITGAP